MMDLKHENGDPMFNAIAITLMCAPDAPTPPPFARRSPAVRPKLRTPEPVAQVRGVQARRGPRVPALRTRDPALEARQEARASRAVDHVRGPHDVPEGKRRRGEAPPLAPPSLAPPLSSSAPPPLAPGFARGRAPERARPPERPSRAVQTLDNHAFDHAAVDAAFREVRPSSFAPPPSDFARLLQTSPKT